MLPNARNFGILNIAEKQQFMFTIGVVVFVVLVLDGLVSMAEAAFFSVPFNRVRLLAERKKTRSAKILLGLKENNEVPITTLISLSNIITIAGSVIIGALIERSFGSWWLAVASAVLTFLIMVFAEIIPKNLGARHAQFIALLSAPLLKAVSVAFGPVIWFVSRIVKPIAYRKRIFSTSEEEISFLAQVGSKEGAIEEGESQIIQKAFSLNDITAQDIMTPRIRVQFIDGNQTIDDAREEILFAKHSRLPVFDGTRDNIIGIAYQRDLLRSLAGGTGGESIRAHSTPAFFVPESRLADDLLRDFQKKKTHIAVVVDEHGSSTGVVGLEDILEELVGEMIDDREVVPETIKRVSRNEIIVHGQTKIESLNHFFNTSIKSRKTVNGFLLGKLGHIPKNGEYYETDGLLFTIEHAAERAIERVRVQKKENVQSDAKF